LKNINYRLPRPEDPGPGKAGRPSGNPAGQAANFFKQKSEHVYLIGMINTIPRNYTGKRTAEKCSKIPLNFF